MEGRGLRGGGHAPVPEIGRAAGPGSSTESPGPSPVHFNRASLSSRFSFRSWARCPRISSFFFSSLSFSSVYRFTSASVLFLPSLISTNPERGTPGQPDQDTRAIPNPLPKLMPPGALAGEWSGTPASLAGTGNGTHTSFTARPWAGLYLSDPLLPPMKGKGLG